jgi:hypothetical protein
MIFKLVLLTKFKKNMKKIIFLMLFAIIGWQHVHSQVTNDPGSSNFTVSATTICSGLPVTFTGATACSSLTQSLNFAGTGTASTTRVLTSDNNLTIEGWIKPNSANGTTSLFYNNGFGLILRGTQISGIVPGRAFLDSNANVIVGIWQHVALVRNAGTWAIYLNGTAYATYATDTNPNNQNRGTFIGCNLNNGEIFDGAISQVAFWNTVRTTNQIQEDMQACSFSGSGLAAYWSLNGNGNDLSGNGHNLNLSNTTYSVDAPPVPPTGGAQYVFDFGDGSTYTSNVGTTIHVYPTASTYTASLSVTYNGSTSTSTNNILVNPTPIASISGPSAACGSATLTASGGTSYSWTSGSSTNTSETTITTTSTPTVTVSNICGCSATASQTVTITPVTVAGTISTNQTITSPTGSGTSLITVDQNLNGGSWISISSDYYPYPEYDPTWFYPGSNEAQSFKASISALWTSLKINVQAINQPGDVTLQIFSGDGVNGTSLLSQNVNISQNGINTFTLSSPISLTAGQFYTFQFSSNGSADIYIDYSNTTSPLGTLYQNGNSINGALYFENIYQIDNANWDNLTLTENTGNVLYWQKSADVGFSNPTTLANTSTTLYSGTVGNLNATTYFRAVVQNGSCDILNTNTVTISSGNTINSTTISACGSYTWANNNVTYTETGIYTGTTTNGITEQLDLTITTQPIVFTSGSINYFVTSPNTVSVGFNGDATGDVVIPESVTTACGSYAVTGINQGAFYYCSGLTSVTIPNSVISIGANSFAYCSSLTSVTLPDTLTSINSGVFSNCSQLSSISIPNSVTSIGDTAFYNCTSLTSVSIPNSVTNMGEFVFQFCSSLSSVSISNSLTSIGKFTFFGCTSLTSVIIPNSVTSIGNNAFQNCSNLNSVTLSNTLTSIGNITFLNCSNLTSITIPNSVTSIGYAAFNGCTGLTSVICNVTSPITINNSVFGGVNQAACSLTVPNGSVAAYQAAAIWQNFAPIFSYSKVMDSQCGTTLSTINTLIKANAITGASAYRFKVIYENTTEIIETTSRWFRLTSLPTGGTFYNTTYTISVSVKKNNVWGDYGDACAVTTPVSPVKIQDAQCGSTLAGLNSPIFSIAKYGATGYRFEVTNRGTVYTYDSLRNYFRLPQLNGPLAKYEESYSIRVSIQLYGVWQPYGTSCIINTPSSPIKVQDTQCGTTLVGLSSPIISTVGSYADTSGYRFEVTSGNNVYTYDALRNSFNLTQLNIPEVGYGASYSIRVSIKLYGIWQPYGISCIINTPLAPLTKLQDRQCGITLNSGNTSLLYANPFSVAQKYRFEVSLGADVYTYETASSSVRSFRMTEVPGLTLVNGTTYAVKVAIMANGVWQPYGESCHITTFGDAPNFVKSMNLDTTNFNVLTYPNPFTENFNLNLTSLSEEKVTVMVYDLTGKLLERKEVVPSELSELQVGTNFTAGIYNVIVSQGAHTKSIRVIKK